MEGSVAGPASAQGDNAQGTDNGQGEAQQGPDLGQLAEQLQSLTASQEDLRQYLASLPQLQQQEGEPQTQEPEPIDLSWLDPTDPGYDPETIADQLGDLIDRTVQQREQELLQRHIQPLQEQQNEERVRREVQELVAEFQDLADPDVAQEVVNVSRQVAEAHGRPELAGEPWFWRLNYMAGRAATLANEEGDAESSPAYLEGGAGTRPGAQQVDMGAQILAAGGGGRSVLPF